MSAETFPPAPLPGHELLDDGKPFVIGDGWALPGNQPGCTPGEGRAICACGTVSPEFRADAARQTWHHGHVSEIRASMTGKPLRIPWDGKPFQVGRWSYGTEGTRR